MVRKEWTTPFIPIVITLIAGICWAIFMLLHTLYWSRRYDLFQNFAILILSLVVMGCTTGLIWVYWIFKRA